MSAPLVSWPPPDPDVMPYEVLTEDGWPPPEPDDWDAIAQEGVNAVDLD